MATVSSKVEPLIIMYHLGTVKKMYKPHTISSIITGLCLTAFACVWIIIALMMTGNFLLMTNSLPFQIASTSFSTDSISGMPFGALSLIFPLFGLIFIAIGLFIIIKAILNRNVRAVLCENGVVYLGRKGNDAFHWGQVATVLDKINVSTDTTSSTNTTRNSHTYTVACKDGRRFIFNNVLSYVEQLGEEIQIAVAIYQKSA